MKKKQNDEDPLVREQTLHQNLEIMTHMAQQLDKEHQLKQEVRLLSKQVHQLEKELELSNDKLHEQEEDNIDLRKQMKKTQSNVEDL